MSVKFTLTLGQHFDYRGKEAADITAIRASVYRDVVTTNPTIEMHFDLPDGRVAVATMTAELIVTAAKAIVATYPELRKKPN